MERILKWLNRHKKPAVFVCSAVFAPSLPHHPSRKCYSYQIVHKTESRSLSHLICIQSFHLRSCRFGPGEKNCWWKLGEEEFVVAKCLLDLISYPNTKLTLKYSLKLIVYKAISQPRIFPNRAVISKHKSPHKGISMCPISQVIFFLGQVQIRSSQKTAKSEYIIQWKKYH